MARTTKRLDQSRQELQMCWRKIRTYMDAAPESSAISARLILYRFFQDQRIPPRMQGLLLQIVAAKPNKEIVC